MMNHLRYLAQTWCGARPLPGLVREEKKPLSVDTLDQMACEFQEMIWHTAHGRIALDQAREKIMAILAVPRVCGLRFTPRAILVDTDVLYARFQRGVFRHEWYRIGIFTITMECHVGSIFFTRWCNHERRADEYQAPQVRGPHDAGCIGEAQQVMGKAIQGGDYDVAVSAMVRYAECFGREQPMYGAWKKVDEAQVPEWYKDTFK